MHILHHLSCTLIFFSRRPHRALLVVVVVVVVVGLLLFLGLLRLSLLLLLNDPDTASTALPTEWPLAGAIIVRLIVACGQVAGGGRRLVVGRRQLFHIPLHLPVRGVVVVEPDAVLGSRRLEES